MLMTTEGKLRNAENDVIILTNNNKILKTEIAVRDAADAEVVRQSEVQTKVIEKKVKQIEKVYVPQIEYVIQYKEDANASSCENANSMLTGIIY